MSAQQKLCDTCGINFEKMSKFAFNEHMLKHKEKTHQCDKCTSIFHTARDLRYHKLKVHGKKVNKKLQVQKVKETHRVNSCKRF